MEKLNRLRKTLVEHWKTDIVDVVCSKQSKIVFITAFLAAFSVILILRLWGIKSTAFSVLSTVAIVVTPAVAVQFLTITPRSQKLLL